MASRFDRLDEMLDRLQSRGMDAAVCYIFSASGVESCLCTLNLPPLSSDNIDNEIRLLARANFTF